MKTFPVSYVCVAATDLPRVMCIFYWEVNCPGKKCRGKLEVLMVKNWQVPFQQR